MYEFGNDDEFVDIHGRHIPTFTIGPHEENVCQLKDLKQTGVAIYQKSQYAKLKTVKPDFDSEFMNHMLDAAKDYMLANKCSFTHAQILNSIQRCKDHLSSGTKLQTEAYEFKDHNISCTGDNILIKAANIQTTPNTKTVVGSKKLSSHLQQNEGSQEKSSNMMMHNDVKKAIDFSETEKKDLQSTYTNNPEKKGKRHFGRNNFKATDFEVSDKKDFKVINQSNTEKQPIKTANHDNNGKTLKGNNITKMGKTSFETVDSSNHTGPKVKRITNNCEKEEFEVLVTSIDKPNCIWVRDLANDKVFEQIHQKVNEEAHFQKAVIRPWVMDNVYMAEDDGCWYRCKIMRFKPLTVLFLDYGTVAEVDEIRHVSEVLAKTPCMAVRITFKKEEYTPRLEDVIRIKCFMKNADGTYFANILKISSNSSSSSSVKSFSSEPVKLFKQPQVQQPQNTKSMEDTRIYTKPPYFGEVKHNQRVAIGCLRDNELFLRTRECFDTLKEIERDIRKCINNPQSVQQPKIDQVVLYEDKQNSKLYRAVVTQLTKNKGWIELIDYGNKLLVDLSTLKTISEELAAQPLTFLKGKKLVGFENQPFPDGCLKLVNEYIENRKKFTAVLGFDDELDLADGKSLLSQRLENFTKNKVLLKDIKTYKPEMGIKPYLCGCYKNCENLTIVASDELQKNMDYILKSEINDDEPYTPILGEVCLCFYVDNWYRCVITRIFDKECEVLLLDFGNMELIRKEDLRKPDRQILDLPALAIPCVLIDVPEHPDIDDLLKKMVLDGEVYNIDIKKIDAGKCQIKIPTVYKKIEDLL